MDSCLTPWSKHEDAFNSGNILIGNGQSISVWSKFKYPSLFSIACSKEVSHPLTSEDLQLFERLGRNDNFEWVLFSLRHAQLVCSSLNLDDTLIISRYRSIRQSLVEAVHASHADWQMYQSFPSENSSLEQVASGLITYDSIYSLNYDLLLYWAMMPKIESYLDFLWKPFDLSDVEIYERGNKRTKVYFLHGGIHLCKNEIGQTIKRKATELSILEQFSSLEDTNVPLFVSEGTWEDKLLSISSSDYLSFCYNQLMRASGKLVILGSNLSVEQDMHIVNAIRNSGIRSICIGLHENSPKKITMQIGHFNELFPSYDLFFFESSEHPLCAPDVRIG